MTTTVQLITQPKKFLYFSLSRTSILLLRYVNDMSTMKSPFKALSKGSINIITKRTKCLTNVFPNDDGISVRNKMKTVSRTCYRFDRKFIRQSKRSVKRITENEKLIVVVSNTAGCTQITSMCVRVFSGHRRRKVKIRDGCLFLQESLTDHRHHS